MLKDDEYPRVLIIGQTFTTDTGGGITLSNLFKTWPKNKLAVAVESKETVDFHRCANYYRIGFNELRMPFPFSFFQRKTRSGPIKEDFAAGDVSVKSGSRRKEQVKLLLDKVFHHIGIFYWLYGRQKLSSELFSWIREFDPQIIYYQTNSYKSMKFILQLKEFWDVPLVSHVMDDWFSYAIKPGPFAFLWKQLLDQKLRKVFSVSKLHLSICQPMSDEYLRRYGYRFYPFHNTVDLKFWERESVTGQSLRDDFHILYAGRIGQGIDVILNTFAQTVEQMGRKGKKVKLEIQTKNWSHPLLKNLLKFKNVMLSKSVPYEGLPEKFSSADALLIPSDFRGSGVKFIKYSMPTKVSEFMATGKPILVVGAPDTALVQYAKEGWALVCESDHPQDIENAIDRLMSSEQLKSEIGARARTLAAENHDENLVREQFKEKLLGLTSCAATFG